MQIDAGRPSPQFVLFWKEAAQLFPIGGAILIGLVALQTLGAAIAYAIPNSHEMFEFFIYSAFLLGPFVFVLGSVGVNIGHERQTGSWSWNSSLPIAWQQALGVKLTTSMVGAGIIALALLVVPAIYLSFGGKGLPATQQEIAVILLLVCLNIGGLTTLCMLFTLCSRDTLTALVVAVFAALMLDTVCLAGLMEPAVGMHNWNGWLWSAMWVSTAWLAGTAGALAVVVLLFSRRWHSLSGSHHSIFGFNAVAGIQSVFNRPVDTQAHGARLQPASVRKRASRMLSSQILLSGLSAINWKTLALGAIALLFALLFVVPNYSENAVAPQFVPVLLFGVYASSTAFAGDKQRAYWRFLSDRGIHPAIVFWTRFAWVALLVFAPVLIVLVATLAVQPGRQPGIMIGSVIGMALGIMGIGFYSSICTSRPILALVLSIFTAFAGVMVMQFVVAASSILVDPLARPKGDGWLVYHAAAWSWLCPLVFFYASWRATRRWILRSEGGSSATFPFWAAGAILAPVFMASSTAFLFLPAVKPLVVAKQVQANAMLVPAVANYNEGEVSLTKLRDQLTGGSVIASRAEFGLLTAKTRDALSFVRESFINAQAQGDYETAALALECHAELTKQLGTSAYSALRQGTPELLSSVSLDNLTRLELTPYVDPSVFDAVQVQSTQLSERLVSQKQALFAAFLNGDIKSDPREWPAGQGFSPLASAARTPGLKALLSYPPIRWRMLRQVTAHGK